MARRGRRVFSWRVSCSTWSVHSKCEVRVVSLQVAGRQPPRMGLTAVFLPRYLRKAFFPKHQDLQFAGMAGVPDPFPMVLRHQEIIRSRWEGRLGVEPSPDITLLFPVQESLIPWIALTTCVRMKNLSSEKALWWTGPPRQAMALWSTVE